MPRDPVCSQYVEEKTPYTSDANGEIRYFCSAECLEEFEYSVEDETFLEAVPREAAEED